ncbi:MAG: PD40 domain-containing protein, partial [Acidobacteria bacterium]|nr:PD40 domain-containing protein [Acidobacteriota bacterium]
MHKAVVVSMFLAGAALAAQTPSATPRAVHVTLHEGTNMAAALSPDGRTIAFDLLGTMWTMPAQGGA